jgi:hypothetical protein
MIERDVKLIKWSRNPSSVFSQLILEVPAVFTHSYPAFWVVGAAGIYWEK